MVESFEHKEGSLSVCQFLAAYNASLANVLELKTITVTGTLESKSDKLYGGELYWALEDGGARLTIRMPERYRDLTGRRVEVIGQPYRQTREDRGEIKIILRVQRITPLERTTEDWMSPFLSIGEKRRSIWPAIVRAIESRILAGDRPTVLMLLGSTSIVGKDVLSAMGQHAAAYIILERRISLTDPTAVASALADQKLDADLVAIVRGGGEGIIALSDQKVIAAVAEVPIPIVSAVGHEPDRPLVQDIVHHAFSTPSAFGTWLMASATGALQARDALALDHMRELEAVHRQLRDISGGLAIARAAEVGARSSESKAREEAGVLRLDLQNAELGRRLARIFLFIALGAVAFMLFLLWRPS